MGVISRAGQLNTSQLALDLWLTTKTKGYGQRYHVVLLSPPELVPFRAYLYFLREWWPVEIDFSTYPFPIGEGYTSIVNLRFQERIPPCPQHRDSWHPNIIAETGMVHFCGVRVPAGNGIVNLLEALSVFLRNPNHWGYRNCIRQW